MKGVSPAAEKSRPWGSSQAYVLAVAALSLGIGLGYFGRGSVQRFLPFRRHAATAVSPTNSMGQQGMPTLDQLKHMADKQAEPLLEQLKTQPNNAGVLAGIARTYFAAHRFQEALQYYEKSLKADPKSVGVRADFASCLFYSGEPDKATATLEEALRYEPENAQALFNLGMIRWKAKGDSAGAIALWQRLLKSNPTLPKSSREQVEHAIASAKQRPT